MAEYLGSKNLTEAVNGVRDMKAPKHFLPEMLSKIIICSLDRPDEDKEHVSTLIHALRAESLITGENFMQVACCCSQQPGQSVEGGGGGAMPDGLSPLCAGFPQRPGPVP